MSRRNPFPAKKSRLPPLGKALVAVHAIQAVLNGRMDHEEVMDYLGGEVGLNWNLLTAMQYLTGKQALGALKTLPANWVGEDGMTMEQVEEAALVAHHMCANFKPGAALSAGDLVKHFKRIPPGPLEGGPV